MSNSASHLIKHKALQNLKRIGWKGKEADTFGCWPQSKTFCVEFPLSVLRSEDISICNKAACVAPIWLASLEEQGVMLCAAFSCDVHSSRAFESSTVRHLLMVGLGVISWLLLPEAPQLRRRLNLGRLKELAEPQATYERNNSRHKTMQDDTKGSANSANIFVCLSPCTSKQLHTEATYSDIVYHFADLNMIGPIWLYLSFPCIATSCAKYGLIGWKMQLNFFRCNTLAWPDAKTTWKDDWNLQQAGRVWSSCLKLGIGQSLGHVKHLTVCWDHQTASLLSNIVVVVDFESGMLKQPFFKPGNKCCSAVLEAGIDNFVPHVQTDLAKCKKIIAKKRQT